MKEPQVLPVDEAIAQLDRFDAIVDARSPAEFALDRLPGAINAPVLDDAQRALVGTVYVQQSAFLARRMGAAIVSRNIATLLEHDFADRPPGWRPLVYCWRGGNRSSALATVLGRVGWRSSILEGGYRAFRARVRADLERLPRTLRWRVLAGRTGSGKSELLRQLAARGEQVLDLEEIARHRGSVLGGLPDSPQPSQKAFETAIWDVLRRFDAERTVFVESESRRVGRCHVPDTLIDSMRNADCIRIDASTAVRASLLLHEYRHFTADTALLFERLDRLVVLHGRERIEGWKKLASAGCWQEFVESLLSLHYDPAYERSIGRNYLRVDDAKSVRLESADGAAFGHAARAIAEAALSDLPTARALRDT